MALGLMSDLLLAMVIVVAACAALQQFFSFLLRRRIPEGSSVHSLLFASSRPGLTQGRRMPGLRLRFVLPWISSPDISGFGSSSQMLLLLCRLCATTGLVMLLSVLALGIVTAWS
jgi:hypothetical protein